jgi:hypothetical protein
MVIRRRSVKSICLALPFVGLGFPLVSASQPKETCYVQDAQCQITDGGPYIIVTAKVFPEGLGVEVSVVSGTWERTSAVTFAESFAQEVMAFKGLCLKGYTRAATTGGDNVSQFIILCKQ